MKIFLFFLVILGVAITQDTCADEPDSYCFDDTCGVELYDQDVGSPCNCTDENIGAKYGACKNGVRQLVYFWRPPATCLNGILPAPVEGVPCDLRCTPGQYLNVSTSTPTCAPCQPGTSSNGWGHVWDEWSHWPAQISTHCAVGDPRQTCSGWVLDGETINSGDNHLVNYMQSSLVLNVKLVSPGWVAYSYMVSAEDNYDGLWVVIDDLALMFISNTRDEYRVANHSLSAGVHTIQWQYFKDRSISRGLDQASIDWIQVMGTTYAFTQCEECPLGHYQNQTGADECVPCPPGTYGPTTGRSECIPCDEGKSSYAGAVACQIQTQCSTLDAAYYTFDLSPCVDGQQTVTYRFIEPVSCANPNASVLPASRTQSCEVPTCRPGEFKNGTTCEYCPTGTSSPGGDVTNCTTCQMGSVADDRTVYIEDWSQWPQVPSVVFQSGCNGITCYSSQWRLASQYIDSGIGHGAGAMPWVEMSVSGYNGGNISIDYSLACETGNELVLSVDGMVIRTFDCAGDCNSTQIKTFAGPLRTFDTSSNHTWNLRWTYMKNTNYVGSCDRVLIHRVAVTGLVGFGGSPACSECPNGTSAVMSGMDHCAACPRGSSSLPDGDICLPCEGNSFADKNGMPCLECGAQTFVNSMHTQCDLNCSAITFVNSTTNDTRVYDLTQIGMYNVTLNYIVNNTVQEYDILGSICEWHPACVDAAGELLDSYMCYETEFGLRNMGKVMSISELQNSTGLLLEYTEGLQFPFGFRGGLKCTSRLTLKCDPDVDVEGPVFEPGFNASTIDRNCTINLSMRSRFACLKCREEDLDIHDTDCENGELTRFYSFKHLCSGGVELPRPHSMPCSASVTVKSNTVIILIVVIVIFFMGAAGGLGFLFWRNRQLYEKYTQLASRDVPMDEDIPQEGAVRLETN